MPRKLGRSDFSIASFPEASLDEEVEALATSLAKKSRHALFSTKRHVNAITEQMVGTSRSWSDADGMVAGFADEEAKQIRVAYLKAQQDRKTGR